MTRYVIVRHGSNGANQHLTPEMVVGTVEARGWRKAISTAAEKWTCYNNQYFSPIAWSRASVRQRDDALEGDQAEPVAAR